MFREDCEPALAALDLPREARARERRGRDFEGVGRSTEVFSDADTYRVLIESGTWTGPERWVLFAAAVSIDFDFFENNQGSDGLFSFGD